MEERRTVTELVNEAIELRDKGEWDAARFKLERARETADETIQNIDELVVAFCTIDMHDGWISWKKGEKGLAEILWMKVLENGSDIITQASAHAGLGIYYAEMGEKDKALYHSKLAFDLLPEEATMNQSMNLNACGIAQAKIGELERAEEILLKVARINEQLERSSNSVIAKKAKHQRAKNGYNLASLVYISK